MARQGPVGAAGMVKVLGGRVCDLPGHYLDMLAICMPLGRRHHEMELRRSRKQGLTRWADMTPEQRKAKSRKGVAYRQAQVERARVLLAVALSGQVCEW